MDTRGTTRLSITQRCTLHRGSYLVMVIPIGMFTVVQFREMSSIKRGFTAYMSSESSYIDKVL